MNWRHLLHLDRIWPREERIKVVTVHSDKLRLKAWRSDERMLSAALTLQGNHTYQTMVQVLRSELLAMASGLTLAATVPEQVALQRIIQGYQLCLEHMESMSKKPEKQTRIEKTFLPENDLSPKQNNKRPAPTELGW